MALLLVSATELEIAPLLGELRFYSQKHDRLKSYEFSGKSIDVLITGVGMTATAAWVAKTLAEQKYSEALNVGLCGSFDPKLQLGDVVKVGEDCIAHLGAEDGDDFLSVHQLNLLPENEPPFTNGKLFASYSERFTLLNDLPDCCGITVNRVHGLDASIEKIVARLNPQVESMEGSGFYYACGISNVPALQVRAVSNYVERRNRANWKITEAVNNLNQTILDFLRA
ncbi:MAG TPA: futalosine hydrolase [Bacteroidia bacterium]|nr:futalosine hydrolase [Bacteroidia bacterium]